MWDKLTPATTGRTTRRGATFDAQIPFWIARNQLQFAIIEVLFSVTRSNAFEIPVAIRGYFEGEATLARDCKS
jgi:hypothetical protein